MNARACALAALVAVEEASRHAQLARVQQRLDLGATPRVDRPLALELALGVERMRILLDLVLRCFVDRGLPSAAPTLSTLRLGAYQLMFLTRIPLHAAVHETVKLGGGVRGFVNAVLRRVAAAIEARAVAPEAARREIALPRGSDGVPRTLVLPKNALPDPLGDPAGFLAALNGLPSVLVERWRLRYGPEECERIVLAASTPADVFLRARLELGGAVLAERLGAEGVEVEPAEHPLMLKVAGGRSPFETRSFERGEFVAQDPTALATVEALDAQPGESVLDLCAAPGTKAAYLAERVGPSGRVVAHDVDASRLRLVQDNARRLRLPWLETAPELPRGEAFDRVLVDAPCSNTGVLSRRVEVRRRIDVATIATQAGTQKRLLREAFACVRPGGHVLYATCSIEPEENEHVVEAATPTAATVVAQRLTLPIAHVHDGGFWALLRKAP